MRKPRIHPVVLALTAIAVIGTTVLGHVDLSGAWGQRCHEDLPERGAGPEIGDYLGLPINAIFGRENAASGGSLEVVTTNLSPGYLRPNGVPYSGRTVVKEFLDSFTLPEDGTWLIVTTVIADPDYLTQEFVLSSQFKKDTDLSKWNPRPCEIPAPVVPARAPA
jgi:hypothetical protein